jgi:hypothetical protein
MNARFRVCFHKHPFAVAPMVEMNEQMFFRKMKEVEFVNELFCINLPCCLQPFRYVTMLENPWGDKLVITGTL